MAKSGAGHRPIAPGATLGILGGGQLGRMMAVAAAALGLKTHIFCPDADCPAFDVAAARTVAAYEDEDALSAFAAAVDVCTYEFENVPGRTAEILADRVTLRPNAQALATAQDRLIEKQFVTGLGIATAPFRAVDSEHDLAAALEELGAPAILKTRRFGYDGKGQVRIQPGDRPGEAYAHLGGAPAILEGLVRYSQEISVLAARGPDGAFAAYEPCHNEHRDGILAVTRVPADVPAALEQQAVEAARAIADALDYVGVIAVEMFVVEGGVAVNEIAPRVHNSGHWTIEGAETSQFEQHVRAVCGWPLGATGRRGRVEMRNLIGSEIDTWPAVLAEPGAHLHHYGKLRARPGRKMGHVTRVWT
ncbi:5-(carboxyamino)imidazole ribonucleotide synthase [Enterovirga sp.]|jgi:5-(carboxyamino)imidazole ribonucleotide synthase|uniref:5-(carboxyamino)imidazole ribonucleotide synthase n=1 Tax=Enterovirga sp. TaxID=2026350 RepID=UPI0026305BED|nr:5-(carboxyamino)imidazole ribonucleotide synthase [Enterovirga sp.]MDB5592560.1 5-(carboxyamino)imidazole ribonucleotide synthase [Enterovirga sp.]